ncbi:MAG TPA: hypothetical protein VME43_28620 [Bryobacteraceae bacterium]|nr:hypothetical protein [Bryobacteraceae bacterium]
MAVRIGFDDNRSLGAQETGARVALPVFKEIVLSAYGKKPLGAAPLFPPGMERRIDDYLKGDSSDTSVRPNVATAPMPEAFPFVRAERSGLLQLHR